MTLFGEYLGDGVYTCWLFGESRPHAPFTAVRGTHLYKLPDCIAEGYDIEFELTDVDQHLTESQFAKQETGYVHLVTEWFL